MTKFADQLYVDLMRQHGSVLAAANARLRQLGDNVVVVPARSGCPSLGSLPAPAVHAKQIGVQASGPSGGSITVNARGVPAGDILVVAVEMAGKRVAMASALTSPPAPSWVSLPALPAGPGDGPGNAGGSGSAHGSGSAQ
jgi:hypothetical protein